MPYSVAVVGCGVIGKRLGLAFQSHKDTDLKYAVDINQKVLDEYCDQFGTQGFSSYTDLLSFDDVDIIYVGIPPKFHTKVVLDALNAGKHVICEKPIALSANDGYAMARKAQETGLVTAINFPFNHMSSFETLKELVYSGQLGSITDIQIKIRFPKWPRSWQDVAWLKTFEQGGPLREVGSHFIYAVQNLFGTLNITQSSFSLTEPASFENEIQATFTTVAGLSGSIDLITLSDDEEENTLYITGNKRTIRFRNWYILEEFVDGNWAILDDTSSNSSLNLINAFTAHISEDPTAPTLVSFEEASHVQAVIDQIFQSPK